MNTGDGELSWAGRSRRDLGTPVHSLASEGLEKKFAQASANPGAGVIVDAWRLTQRTIGNSGC